MKIIVNVDKSAAHIWRDLDNEIEAIKQATPCKVERVESKAAPGTLNVIDVVQWVIAHKGQTIDTIVIIKTLILAIKAVLRRAGTKEIPPVSLTLDGRTLLLPATPAKEKAFLKMKPTPTTKTTKTTKTAKATKTAKTTKTTEKGSTHSKRKRKRKSATTQKSKIRRR